MAWTEEKSPGRFTGWYRDAAGRKRSAGTSDDAQVALDAAKAVEDRIKNGEVVDPLAGLERLDDYFDSRWITRRRLELNGKATYRSHYNSSIRKRFGKMPVKKITRTMVQDWIDDMEKGAVTPTTIRARVATLQVILAAKRGVSAVNDGLRDDNPCHAVTMPIVVAREVQIYTPDQVDLLVEALDEWWRLLVLFDSETGLRWGELAGLVVSDIDFLQRRCVVSRTIVEVSTEDTGTGTPFAVKPYPKGKTPRVVGITPETIELLSVHVKRRGLKRDDRLFAMPVLNRLKDGSVVLVPEVERSEAWPKGVPISRSYFAEVWHRAVRKAKLPMRRRHDLRASFISWLLDNAELSPQQVMDIVGHADWKTTRKYAKSLDRTQEAGVEAIRSIRERYRADQKADKATS